MNLVDPTEGNILETLKKQVFCKDKINNSNNVNLVIYGIIIIKKSLKGGVKMTRKKSLIVAMLIFVISIATVINPSLSANAIISTSDAKLHYIGRVDKSKPGAVSLIWEGTTINANFQGTSLKMQLENSSDNHLNIFIDGNLTVVKCLNGDNLYTLASGLEDKVHSVSIFKRTESGMGAVTFKGFILDDGKELADPDKASNLKIEFYGDSITAGACDEDPIGQEQWGDRSTHNNYMSYGAIAARGLNAEYMCTAVSGIGLTHGGQQYTMPQVWDKVWYDINSAIWDFSLWQADYVVVNLGENDLSSGSIGDFSAEYVKLIKSIRGKYPNASIFCVLGPMGASQSQTYINYVSSAVNTLKSSGDNKVFFHKFSQSAGWEHPRVQTNIEVANELVNVIKSNASILLGDANDDGVINIFDLIVVKKFIIGKDVAINLENADLNSDSKINIIDYIKLKKMFIE